MKNKIAFYRKKNLMSQEDLADKLNVSRQAITKWEGGLIYPSVEYLIEMSNLFRVTIDTLIKDDECIRENDTTMDISSLENFIVMAKKETYASKNNKVVSLRKGAHDYKYSEKNFQYCDSFFGSRFFSGQEIIYQDDEVCWAMNYYGRVLSDEFNSNFLKEALLTVNKKQPFRGQNCYQNGDYTYICKSNGDFYFFNGFEEIYYQSNKIYEGMFHGGMIK